MQPTENSFCREKLKENYERFFSQGEIAAFLRRGGQVFVATEGVVPSVIELWLELGQRHFAEKYVQETAAKWPELKRRYPDLTLHHYGHLQSNKLLKALSLYQGLESVDSLKLVQALAKRYSPQQQLQHFWAQVNLGKEPQKTGIAPEQLEELVRECQQQGIGLRGLMAIPPRHLPAAPFFKQLKELSQRYGLAECLMGMSGDFKEAIDQGTSAIRIRRALLE
jgi:hypothetical protein